MINDLRFFSRCACQPPPKESLRFLLLYAGNSIERFTSVIRFINKRIFIIFGNKNLFDKPKRSCFCSFDNGQHTYTLCWETNSYKVLCFSENLFAFRSHSLFRRFICLLVSLLCIVSVGLSFHIFCCYCCCSVFVPIR